MQIAILESKEKLYEKVKGLSPSEQIKKRLSIGKPFSDEIRELKNLKKAVKDIN